MQWLDCILVACLCASDRNLIKPLFSNNNTNEKPRSSVLEVGRAGGRSRQKCVGVK